MVCVVCAITAIVFVCDVLVLLPIQRYALLLPKLAGALWSSLTWAGSSQGWILLLTAD